MGNESIFKNRIINGHPETIIDGFVFENFKINNTQLNEINWLDVTDWELKGFHNPKFIKKQSK